MTLHLVTNDEDQPLYVFDPAVLDDWWLVSRKVVIRPEEIGDWDSTELAWQITHRVLSVQRWSRYYGLSTHAFAALFAGMTRR